MYECCINFDAFEPEQLRAVSGSTLFWDPPFLSERFNLLLYI